MNQEQNNYNTQGNNGTPNNPPLNTNQIVGYLMSGDPGYISSHKEARNKISSFDRTKILEIIVEDFINNK